MKMAANISVNVILDNVRSSFSAANIGRIHLLTKQDLHNIEKRYNLHESINMPQSPKTTIDEWVAEMKMSETSCILFYKPQGYHLQDYQELDVNDFALIIMNEAQCEMIKKYSGNILCIDRTCDVNSYNFELFTVMVVDESKISIPCAFMISNRSDHIIFTIYFTLLKENIGKLRPSILLTDMSENIYNTWLNIMEIPKKRLFCSWHVDFAWRKKLAKIRTKEKQTKVHKTLRMLLKENNSESFEKLLEYNIKQMFQDNETSQFADYFANNFLNNVKNWAYCYRIDSGIEINTHLEQMHRTIKYIYLEGKRMRHLNKSVHAIMQFIRDKLIDKVVTSNTGKIYMQLREIRERHRKSKYMSKSKVILDGQDWKIASISGKELYTIQKVDSDCSNCELICVDCKVCLHHFTCSCIDSAIKWKMCKHIHLICQLIIEQSKSEIALCDTTSSEHKVHCTENSILQFPQVNVPEIVQENTKNNNQVNTNTKIMVQSIELNKNELNKQFKNILELIKSREELEFVKNKLESIEPVLKRMKCELNGEVISMSKILLMDKL